MLTRAEERGHELRARFGLSATRVDDHQLTDIAATLGLRVLHRDIGDVPDAWLAGLIIVNSRMTRDARRWWTAHAIGHHILHRGSYLDLPTVILAGFERQAEILAGTLLLGETIRWMNRADLAAYHQLPEEALARWFGLRDGSVSILGLWERQLPRAQWPGAGVGYLVRATTS